MEQGVHELDNMELIDALCHSIVAAGTFNHGRVFDRDHNMHVSEAQRLRAAVLARLDGHAPPAQDGDSVTVKVESDVVEALNRTRRSASSPQLVTGVTYTVLYVHYLGGGSWGYALRGMDDHLFPAEGLTLITRGV